MDAMDKDNKKYHFHVAQKAEIKKNGKFLVIKRSTGTKQYPGAWDFPGGRLEWGENSENGLEREVLEETGLKVKSGRPVFAYSEERKTKDIWVYYAVLPCRIEENTEIKLSHEHTEWAWKTREEIMGLEIEEFLKKYMEEVIE